VLPHTTGKMLNRQLLGALPFLGTVLAQYTTSEVSYVDQGYVCIAADVATCALMRYPVFRIKACTIRPTT
jgi:hypothetical protein